jgi:putative membrane protein
MHEDNHQEDTAMTQTQRLNRIGEVLEKTHLDVYRRHIASKA